MLSASAAAKHGLRAALALMLLVPQAGLAASTTVTANVCHAVIAATTLTTSTPNPTISATANLAGTTEANAAVAILSSSTPIATVLANASGNYAISVAIAVGDNHLTAVGTDACGHQSTSSEILITRNAVPPPAPTITTPADGTNTPQTTITFAGTTEPSATVTISRDNTIVAMLTADSSGRFSATVGLELGTNEFTAIAENAAGPGPASPSITVTRTVPPPTPSPAASSEPAIIPPTAPVGPSLAVPVILAPQGAIEISTDSTVMTFLGQAGTTLEINRGETLLYSLKIDIDGPVSIDAAQEIGTNSWTARARRGNAVSGPSAAVIITRRASAPAAPSITEPSADTTSRDGSVWIVGTSEPGSIVNVFANGRAVAQIMVGDSGTFRVQVGLKPGTNAIYIEATHNGLTSRSGLTIIDYSPPAPAAQLGRQLTLFGQAMAGTVMGVTIVTAQAISDLATAIAESPPARAVVLAAGLVAPIWVRGVVGLEFFITLIALLRDGRWRRLRRPIITDAVTGHRLSFFQTRSGYLTLPSKDENHLIMEPSTGPTSMRRLVFDIVTGLGSWVLLVLSTFVSLTLAATHPTFGTIALASLFCGLLVINAWQFGSQPHYKWGHLHDEKTGKMLPSASIQLQAQHSDVTSTYKTRPDGRYTLWAKPGTYELTAKVPGYHQYHETVTIRHHAAYLGLNLALKKIFHYEQ